MSTLDRAISSIITQAGTLHRQSAARLVERHQGAAAEVAKTRVSLARKEHDRDGVIYWKIVRDLIEWEALNNA